MAKTSAGRPIMPTGSSDRPLVVRLVKEPQAAPSAQPRRLLIATFIVILIIYGGLEILHFFESAPLIEFEDAPTDVKARLRYPEFASVGDASYIEMTAIYTGASPISGTLVIDLQESPVILLPDNRADLIFTDLPPGDQISHRLEFRPVEPWDLPAVGSLSFKLLLLLPGGQKYTSKQQEIDLMPLPYLSRVLIGLRGGFIASLAALFWERIKKWLFR
jgi:hypothetical protein